MDAMFPASSEDESNVPYNTGPLVDFPSTSESHEGCSGGCSDTPKATATSDYGGGCGSGAGNGVQRGQPGWQSKPRILNHRSPRPSFDGIVDGPTHAISWVGDDVSCGCGCQECRGAKTGCGCSGGAGGNMNVLAPGWDDLGNKGGCGVTKAAMAGGGGGPNTGVWDNPDLVPWTPSGSSGKTWTAPRPDPAVYAPRLGPTTCDVPTIQPFQEWPSRLCFSDRPFYWDTVRKSECCDLTGFQMGPTQGCRLPSQTEIDAVATMLRFDWTAWDDQNLRVVAPKVEWEELFLNAWVILISNLDLLAWTTCFLEELLTEPSPFWEPAVIAIPRWMQWTAIVSALASDHELVALNSDEPAVLSTPNAGGPPLHTQFFPYYSVTATSADLMIAWRSARDQGDVPRQLCLLIYLATLALHELLHQGGETHPAITNDAALCEAEYAVQWAWMAGVSERYGRCLDNTCCSFNSVPVGTVTALPSRYGGASKWVAAFNVNTGINDEVCKTGVGR